MQMSRGISASWRRDILDIPPWDATSLVEDDSIYIANFLEREKPSLQVGVGTVEVKGNYSQGPSVMAAFMKPISNCYMGRLGGLYFIF
jgi:hypothetical protein